MLRLSLYGHQTPSTTKPRLTHPLTKEEINRYLHHAIHSQHLYEPDPLIFTAIGGELPALVLPRTRPISSLPFHKGLIGHKKPLGLYPNTEVLTNTFIYEGAGVNLELGERLANTSRRFARYPRPVRYEKFIALIRFWQISLQDALDYLDWEYIRTDGLSPVKLPQSIPELPYWADHRASLHIDREWRIK